MNVDGDLLFTFKLILSMYHLFERLADDTKRKTYRFLFIGLIYKEVLWLSSLAQVLDFNIQPYTMGPNNQLST